jgi:hypothetical protein
VPATTICRPSSFLPNTNPPIVNTCDPPEYCTGNSGLCPDDLRLADNTECNDSNACTGAATAPDVCSGGLCQPGPAVNCDDGNPCNTDSCAPGSGCVYTADTSCSEVTNSSLCTVPNPFNLAYIQAPYTPPGSTTLITNMYQLNASQPGQFYYNVFYGGVAGADFTLHIQIPYPFVTQGAQPIQIHNSVGPTGIKITEDPETGIASSSSCFAPGSSLSGFDISTGYCSLSPGTPCKTDGDCSGVGICEQPRSPSGAPVILLANYGCTSAVVGTTFTTITVSGKVPSTGLVYVTIHLDHGFKQTAGWMPVAVNGDDKPPFKALNPGGAGGPPCVPAGALLDDHQGYNFSFDNGVTIPIDDQIANSVNDFKKNKGVAGLTLLASNGSPVSGVHVKLTGPVGFVPMYAVTDDIGYFTFEYKHTGKAANFTVTLTDPVYSSVPPKTVTLKANGFAIVIFNTL